MVDAISITGNKKTKEWVLLRELDFAVGDTLEQAKLMTEILPRNRLQLINTGLVSEVEFNIKNWDTEKKTVHIAIDAIENLFIIPLPIFELADRNFSVWWNEMNADLSRINWGLRLYHFNLTGRGDKLKVAGQLGYTKKAELEYTLPSINKKRTLGLFFNVLRSRNKEIAYTTRDNKLQFERADNEYIYSRFRATVGLTHRPKLYFKQQLNLAYYKHIVDDFVVFRLNKDFLGGGRNNISYFSLKYETTIDNRNLKAYPTKGAYFSGIVKKEGLGIFGDRNALSAQARYSRYFPLSKRIFLELAASGRYAFIREKQPYFDNKALGYENDYLRGYEYYVIDGLDYLYQKTSIRYVIIDRKINFGKLMPISSMRIMPTSLYFTANSDLGAANDPFYAVNNPMTNTLLWGRGVGLDLVVYYAYVLKLEYSFNHLGEKGFFIHIDVGL